MKIANVILPAVLGLAALPAVAQEAHGSGKGSPGDMSNQEYLIQRAKILLRMNAASPQQGQPAPKDGGGAQAEAAQESAYGRGYASRRNAKDAAQDRPNTPNTEHSAPERPQRPERPQIERPGR